MTEQRAQNELVLSPGEYSFTQDSTNGIIKVHTGPNVVNATNQETPVSYDHTTRRFKRVALAESAQQFITALQGQYVVLTNPAVDAKQPQPREKTPAAQLSIGQKVNLQGPATFALWPGQSARVVDGHNLRSNQYLRIRVYDEEMAKLNWSKGVIKAAAVVDGEDEKAQGKKGSARLQRSTLFDKVPDDLAVGKHYIVRGDEFSFYIPPTGVEVVPDEQGGFVRDAVTLERLDYCILIDENGIKRYERGPKVVFPAPTERFFEETDKKGERHVIFQPIELNEIQGVHVKVISDYEENGKKYKEGEELFIRGTEMQFYFPRPEHALVAYDGKHKHFATAVPAGEARYVLNRKTGDIRMVKGPTMLLPDPRTEVIVRRVLSDRQCQLWYPGNEEARRYNSALRELSRGASSSRGAVSEGEVSRSRKLKATSRMEAFGVADKSTTHSDTLAIGAEELERASTYTEPRTLTLDTKFSGVPTVEVYTGYAVLVVDKKGNRRVEVGPKTLLLEYDETLEVLTMSTGKPKNTDSVIQTVFLRVRNNQISDIITAETRDHVNVTFKVSLRGDFIGESNRWFEAENYVKLVCDHVRSVIKGAVRKSKLEELHADPATLVRDTILGMKPVDGDRSGMAFDENGFQLMDVEVLGFTVGDEKISRILENTQHQIVEANISLALNEKKLDVDRRNETLRREGEKVKAESHRELAELKAQVEALDSRLSMERVNRNLQLAMAQLQAQVDELKKREEVQAVDQQLINDKHTQELSRTERSSKLELETRTASLAIDMERLKQETAAVATRFEAASGPFAEAMVALGSQDTLVKVSEAMGVQNYIGGKSLTEALQKVFAGTPLERLATTTLGKALPQPATNGAAVRS